MKTRNLGGKFVKLQKSNGLYDRKRGFPGHFSTSYGLFGEEMEAICLLFTFTSNFQ